MIGSILAFVLFLYSPAQVVSLATSLHSSYHGNSSIEGLTQYLGIRYAKPPVGDLRFAPPQAWPSQANDPIDATAYGPGCPQIPAFELYNGLSEDCLTLNVIVPSDIYPKAQPLPVMFFIHGGGNYNGQSIFYNGTTLVQHSMEIRRPIIYVGINYRLGGFGFLAGPTINDAGLSNVGLMDQHLALEWVHDQIANFGGDPEKVTIFGESAGAVDCWAQLHYAYMHEEDGKYFRAMITQSGAPGSPSFPQVLPPDQNVENYDQLLMATNCTDAQDTITCLRAVSYNDIAPILINGSVAHFTLDGVWFNDSFINLLEAGEYSHIPIIHGANLDEGSAFMPDMFDFPNASALTSTIAASYDDNEDLASNITKTYFSLPPSELGKGFNADPTASDNYYPAMAIYSDIYMHLGRRAWLKKASMTQPAWGYVFEQQPPISTLNLSYEYPGYSNEYYRRLGVYHGSELPYVFGEISVVANRTDGDVNLARRMMTWWITFAYKLDPNCNSGDMYWPPYNSTKEGVVMSLQDQGGVSSKPARDTMRQAVYDAWNDVRNLLGLDELF